MQQNIFPSNHIKNTNCNNNLSGHVHSCPFCKCKSLDNLDKMYPKHYVESSTQFATHNPFISSPNLSKDLSNLHLKAQNFQNIYYRPFDSNKRESISPNFNKKIVIQYFSPAPKFPPNLTNNVSTPFIQQKTLGLQNLKISPTKISPRTIYTNQNTPPKAKFLQKRESKKKSPQKVTFQMPFQCLKSLQSQKIPKQILLNKQEFHIPYEPFKFLSMNKNDKKISIQKSQQFFQPFKVDYLQGIVRTSTKNILQQKSSTPQPQSVGSPFNSLVDTTPQVVPYGSFSSTPIIPNDTSQKRPRESSINQIAEFKEEESEVKLNRKISEPADIEKYQFIPKQIQIPQIQYRKDYKLQKTLGKNDYDQRLVTTENELIYSQSDQKTIQNQGGSQKNIFQSKILKITSNQTQSQRNMKMIPDNFQKKKNKFDFTELSDNFQTPKSKYKAMRESKINESKKSIKFKVVGENRKSKISTGSIQSINQLIVQNSIKVDQKKKQQIDQNKSMQLKQSGDSKQFLKHQSLIKEKKEEIKEIVQNYQGYDRDQAKQVSIRSNEVKTIERQNSLAVSNEYAGQLNQELKLNYDYYFFQLNRKYSQKDTKDDIKTKLPDSGNQYLPDSSASSHGPINISF